VLGLGSLLGLVAFGLRGVLEDLGNVVLYWEWWHSDFVAFRL